MFRVVTNSEALYLEVQCLEYIVEKYKVSIPKALIYLVNANDTWYLRYGITTLSLASKIDVVDDLCKKVEALYEGSVLYVFGNVVEGWKCTGRTVVSDDLGDLDVGFAIRVTAENRLGYSLSNFGENKDSLLNAISPVLSDVNFRMGVVGATEIINACVRAKDVYIFDGVVSHVSNRMLKMTITTSFNNKHILVIVNSQKEETYL